MENVGGYSLALLSDYDKAEKSNKEKSIYLRQAIVQMTTRTISSSSTGNSAILNLATVLKASLERSGKIYLDRLLSTLMPVVMENAGVSKSHLMREATGISGSAATTVLHLIPVKTCDELPKNIINEELDMNKSVF